jgi:hypothetical protein
MTGGQYEIYNCMLRRHPEDRFRRFDEGANLFSTTIAVLSSAVQKLARIAPLREGTPLYRGLDRLMELPDSFFRPDDRGRRGFAEWGFFSTTQAKEMALRYAGACVTKLCCLLVVRGARAVPVVCLYVSLLTVNATKNKFTLMDGMAGLLRAGWMVGWMDG